MHLWRMSAMFIAAVGWSLLAGVAGAADQHVQASLVADTDAIVPGQSFTLGVLLKMSPHWHTYWVNPGESGQATTIKPKGPPGVQFGQIQWPLPEKLDAPGGFSYGYEDTVLLMVPVTVTKEFKASSPAEISAAVTWLSCSGEQCVEGSAKDLKVALPVAKEAHPANAAMFDQWRSKLPVALEKNPAFEVDQKMSPEGSPLPEIHLKWKTAPAKVQFFPEAPQMISIENVAVEQTGQTSIVKFKPTVYKSARGTEGILNGVVIYEESGTRHGVRMSFRVDTGKK